jgi:transcriptional regulator GlxA family with amidase domain
LIRCTVSTPDLVLQSGAAGRVRSLLSTDVAERLSFAAVAKLLKTTTRTLRRQLRLQNTSFRELSDEFRVHVALRYLRETTMTMEDIAFALGFSDSANFRHAFRRWTGKAPHEFRRGGGTGHLNGRRSNAGRGFSE